MNQRRVKARFFVGGKQVGTVSSNMQPLSLGEQNRYGGTHQISVWSRALPFHTGMQVKYDGEMYTVRNIAPSPRAKGYYWLIV